MTMFDVLSKKIKKEGSLDLSVFMEEVLTNEKFGYYAGKYVKKMPFGKNGDFITAPEISQLFGEIIGIWAAFTWEDLFENHSKKKFNLVEFGPGRGTLMSDLLRATKNVPNFYDSAEIFMVEISDYLTKLQKEALVNYAKVKWVEGVKNLPPSPTIFVANEFLDALPISQFVKAKERWFLVSVKLEEELGNFAFDHLAISDELNVALNEKHVNAYDGAVVEFSVKIDEIFSEICAFLKQNGGKAIFIDYGYYYENLKMRMHYNSTLQAVKEHKFHPVLQDLGEADLTAHVDFGNLEEIAKQHELKTEFMTQKDFLEKFGINIRAARLMKMASAHDRNEIMSGVERLCHKEQMGELFKVMIISHK